MIIVVVGCEENMTDDSANQKSCFFSDKSSLKNHLKQKNNKETESRKLHVP